MNRLHSRPGSAANAEVERQYQTEDAMIDALLAGIREDHDSLKEADARYFALTGHHVQRDARKHLMRLGHNHEYIVPSRK